MNHIRLYSLIAKIGVQACDPTCTGEFAVELIAREQVNEPSSHAEVISVQKSASCQLDG